MKIASGLNGLMLSRIYNNNSRSLSTTTARLASGSRINSAHDDAAGLAISTRFTSQIRGMRVGQRNLNDAVSLLQVADGGLSEVSSMLQRMRELAVRAANTGTVTMGDRKMLQVEVSELTQEIQSTFNKTEFNGLHILTPLVKGRASTSSESQDADLLYALKSSWMSQAEQEINNWYGISADNVGLNVVFDDTGSIGAEGAAVTAANYNAGTGLYDDLTLTVDTVAMAGAAIPDGGSGPIYYDRQIAREMTKAVMHRNVNTQALPQWFLEGAAELLVGGDERVNTDGGVAAVMAQDITTWTDTSAERSKSYLAVRYINDVLISKNKTMADLFAELKANAAAPSAKYLFDAINTVAGLSGGSAYNSEGNFMSKFNTYANANYLTLDLANASDVGAIGGAEANGVNTRGDVTAEGVIANIENYEANPTNFDVTFPTATTGATSTGTLRSMGNLHLYFQYGANVGDAIQVDLINFSTAMLNIEGLDLTTRAQEAIVLIDGALDKVSESRARFGAQMNRVDHMLSQLETNYESYSASRSRISDTDYAAEMSSFTKTMLLNDSSSAMMAQANSEESLVLSLLDSTHI